MLIMKVAYSNIFEVRVIYCRVEITIELMRDVGNYNISIESFDLFKLDEKFVKNLGLKCLLEEIFMNA